MPPRRRGARRRTAAAAKSPRAARSSHRLSVRHGEPPFKRESRGDAAAAAAAAAGDHHDDGFPLSDDCILLVFSALSAAATTADLVRCAATCTRWRRLISADAAFICHRAPPRTADDPLIRSLALGFFLQSRNAAASAPPRFVPLSAAAAARLQPSFAGIRDGASRVVASCNGSLVLDLRRRRAATSRTSTAVRLGVCNPVTGGGGGGVDVLPVGTSPLIAQTHARTQERR